MKTLALIASLFLGSYAYGISVNPASNVTADSANTAQTIIYRDTNGDFAAGTITATTLAADALSITAPTPIYFRTSTQLATLAPAASGYLVINISRPALCISTGTNAGAWVIVSSKTAAGGGDVNCGLN